MPNTFADVWSIYQRFHLPKLSINAEKVTLVSFINYNRGCFESFKKKVMYNTLRDWIEGDLSPHTLQTIYFSNISENKISDRATPVELLSLEPQLATEPLDTFY